ncbi:DUF4252 domain-containing protein [Paenimyroides ceti]
MRHHKFLVLIILMMSLLSCASFRNKEMDQFYKKYDDQSTSVRIPKLLLKMVSKEKELKPFLKYIKTTRTVVIENVGSQVITDLNTALKKDGYEEYININTSEEQFAIMAIERKDKITHIVIKTIEDGEISLIQSRVNIELEDFSKMLKQLN